MSEPHDQSGRVLIIAGSDSGGGAGIQADIKTVTMLGGYAMTAITAITAQDTTGVHGVWPVALEAVTAQMTACLNDIGTDTVKTGMLGSAMLVEQVAETLDALARATMAKPAYDLWAELGQRYAEMLYRGEYFSQQRKVLDAAATAAMAPLNGSVTLATTPKLFVAAIDASSAFLARTSGAPLRHRPTILAATSSSEMPASLADALRYSRNAATRSASLRSAK